MRKPVFGVSDQVRHFRFRNNCTIYVAKTKALIRCAVTAQLICLFVFAYAKSSFSHDAAQLEGVPAVTCVASAQHLTKKVNFDTPII